MAVKKSSRKKTTRKTAPVQRGAQKRQPARQRRQRQQAPDGYSFMKGKRGDWFVRAINLDMAPGDVLDVEKKDGSTSTVKIRRIVWEGTFDDGTDCIMATFKSLDDEYDNDEEEEIPF